MRSMNSWLHNLPSLVKGKERCTLHVNPVDADRLGVTNGCKAELESRVGCIVVPVKVTDRVAPGVVSLPHGFGHRGPGSRQSVAAEKQPGACSNHLTDEVALDVPSGSHVANGIPVEVSAA